MGKVWHPDFDALSALADGELAEPEASEVRTHAAGCAGCAGEVASFSRTDTLLASPSTDELAWDALKQALVSLPVGRPSPEVDRRIAAMVRERQAKPVPAPGFWPPAPAGVAVRVGVAAALVLALVVGLQGGQAPQQTQVAPGGGSIATAPQQKQAFVAAVQTSVLHSKTNTLYVLQSAKGAVAAYDAKTSELRAQIAVGGRPSALALNRADDLVVVLDSSAKTLTEIDPASNVVVTTIQLNVSGTPTALQVDNGNYVVMSIPTETGRGPAPIVTPGASPTPAASGQVTLIDTATKKVEVTKAVDVAPRLVVPDPDGQFALLVSPDVTTMVDASYTPISTLPGGISAAFDARKGRDLYAILSENAGAADLTFAGRNAPAALHIDGKPYAVTAMPRGGFAVLVGQGGGGRILVVGSNGKADQWVDVAAVGPTLDYDPKTERFTVTSDGAVAFAPLAEPVAVEESQPPFTSPPASAGPSSSPEPGASPAASGPPAATAAPLASDLPQPQTTPEPLPSQPVREVVAVPADVIEVGDGFYRLPLPHAPMLSATSASRMWILDDSNALNALDIENGDIFRLAQLPADANIRVIAAGELYVYAVDTSRARLFVFDVKSEQLSVRPLPVVSVSAATIGTADSLVLAMSGTTQLLTYRPFSGRLSTVDIGTGGISALATDGVGRVWFASGATLGYYDPALRRTAAIAWAGGPITSLVVDRGDVVWAGTADGQVWSVTGGLVTLALTLDSPVSTLTLDPAGRVWYLAPGPSGFRYGPVSAAGHERTVPGPAVGLAPNSQGRAWLADPLGGIYLGLSR